MEKKIIFVISLLLSLSVIGQDMALLTQKKSDLSYTNTPFYAIQDSENPVSKFALSVNPLGFIQFGPVINFEIGLNDNVVLNTHLRFPSFGLLSYLLRSPLYLDELTGIGYGLGLLYFIGDNKSQPYLGTFIEFERTEGLYNREESNEHLTKNKTTAFVFNGGYRFRFSNGFYVNTGLMLGAASTKVEKIYTDWNYSNGPNRSTDITPFGMVELVVGIEF